MKGRKYLSLSVVCVCVCVRARTRAEGCARVQEVLVANTIRVGASVFVVDRLHGDFCRLPWM